MAGYVLCIVREWVVCCDVCMTFFVSYIKVPADRRTDMRNRLYALFVNIQTRLKTV